jgi:hypothetical protein
MTDPTYARIAIQVLAKIKGYDPSIAADEPQVEAWAEHLEKAGLNHLDELLESVTEYFQEPHNRPAQPGDISRIALDKRMIRTAVAGAPEKENWEAFQTLCREALADAKAGDAAALTWLTREFDYYGRCAVLWAVKRKVDWRNNPQLSGGPVNGERGGVGTGAGWERTRRVRTPNYLVPKKNIESVDAELRTLLTEDEIWQVLG